MKFINNNQLIEVIKERTGQELTKRRINQITEELRKTNQDEVKQVDGVNLMSVELIPLYYPKRRPKKHDKKKWLEYQLHQEWDIFGNINFKTFNPLHTQTIIKKLRDYLTPLLGGVKGVFCVEYNPTPHIHFLLKTTPNKNKPTNEKLRRISEYYLPQQGFVGSKLEEFIPNIGGVDYTLKELKNKPMEHYGYI